MHVRCLHSSAAAALAVALVAAGMVGCAPSRLAVQAKDPDAVGNAVWNYAFHRAEDALECVDIGVTLSLRPGFALYADFASVAPGGYGHVDGYFVGMAGGRLGPMRHYQASLGLVGWGYEEVGWGKFDKADLRTLNYQGVGALGLLTPPYGRPASAPS